MTVTGTAAVPGPSAAPTNGVTTFPAGPYEFNPHRRRLARTYGRRALGLGLLGTLSFAVVLFMLWQAAIVALVQNAVAPVTGTGTESGFLTRLLVVVVFVLVLEVASIPWSAVGHLLEHRFGFARGGVRRWVRDTGRSAVGVLLLSTPILLLFLWIAGKGPYWWLYAWAGSVALSVLGSVAAPRVILPFFFRLSKPSDELAVRIARLQDAAGIRPPLPVIVVKTSEKTAKVNAAVAGLGPARWMIVYDTLLEKTPPAEVDAVIAHEIAHAALRHTERSVIAGAIFGLLSFFLVDRLCAAAGLAPSDPTALPALGLFFMGTSSLLGPLGNAYTRYQETKADELGCALLPDPLGMASVQRRLADLDLIDDEPPRVIELLFASHPAPSRRIALAERLAGGASGGSRGARGEAIP